MPKLHQIVALVEGKKTRLQSELTKLHKIHQRKGDSDSNPFAGLSKTYKPKAEDGEQIPPEYKRVQMFVQKDIKETIELLSDTWDTLMTQDEANTRARGDIIVDGVTLATGVPVTFLMYLEKQLNDVGKFVEELPTLDPAYDWVKSDVADAWATKPTETNRTKKIPRNHVVHEGNDKHPPQVQVYNEDVVVGTYSTTLFNGSIPAKDKNAMLDRVRKLKEAVKTARTQANETEAKEVREAGKLLEFVFGVQS